MGEAKAKFRNESGGHLGVARINSRGDEKGISIPPGGEVWLSDEEIRATAEAPARAEDNPFVDRRVVQYDDEGRLIKDEANEPVLANIGPALVQVTSARPVPETDREMPSIVDEPAVAEQPATDERKPPEGSYSEGEEVGDPEAARA